MTAERSPHLKPESLQALHRIVAQYAAAMQELGWTWVDVNPDKHLGDLEEQYANLEKELREERRAFGAYKRHVEGSLSAFTEEVRP